MTMDSSPVEFGELGDANNAVDWSDDDSADFHEPTTDPLSTVEPTPAHSEPTAAVCCDRDDQSKATGIGATDGIELESASALWIDEPMDESNLVSSGQINALFGHFDEEEEITVGSGFATHRQPAPAAADNLEALLQQEIVAFGSAPAEDIRANVDPYVIQLSDTADPSPVTDDSDLLVIEDEVSILPIDGGNTDETEARAVSVDFQAMLSKMRGPN